MGYLNELLSRNPLVIDGDTIRPHHKYTDDLYTGGIKMENIKDVMKKINQKYDNIEELTKILMADEEIRQSMTDFYTGIAPLLGSFLQKVFEKIIELGSEEQ